MTGFGKAQCRAVLSKCSARCIAPCITASVCCSPIPADCRAARDQLDWQELVSSAAAHDDDDEEEASSSSSADTVSGDVDEPSTSVPDTDMQRLRQELHVKTKRFARNLRRQAAHSSSASSTDTGVPAASGAAVAAAAGDSASVQHNLDSLRALITRASGDRWGTTQQSAAEIAQQIADSNRAAGGDGGDDGDEGDDDDEDDDEPLTLTPEEERYADASAVAADLKEMDEIFEVLAKVRRTNPQGEQRTEH